MKSILITAFILLSVCAGVMAADRGPGGFFGSGEFGYARETQDFYTLLELGYEIELQPVVVSLYGGIEVLMEKGHSVFFHPYRDTYTAGGIVQYRFVYFKVEHKCIHSVYSSYRQFEDKFIGADSRTRFGVGFEF